MNRRADWTLAVALAVTAACPAAGAFAQARPHDIHEAISVLGVTAAGTNAALAATYCQLAPAAIALPPGMIERYRQKTRLKYPNDPNFDADFAKGRVDAETTARNYQFAVAHGAGEMVRERVDQCRDILARMAR